MTDATSPATAGVPAAQERFHQASWAEPLIYELSVEGRRGIRVPKVDPEIRAVAGETTEVLPRTLRRSVRPELPELSQVEVLRHYLRLSQETLGSGMVADMGMATATMKYNPIVNETFVRSPAVAGLHPRQPAQTAQGMLEIMCRLEQMLVAISGMARFSFQPRAGSAAIYTNAAIIRAYHAEKGDAHRDEIITTVFSHPSDAACPSTAGFRIITLYPDSTGYPSVESLKAAISERTAGIMLTNPDDTGIFNPRIREFVDSVHEAGGLCAYDQANANGLLGIARAGDAGFDMCHFNLHKTFSTPHASGGPASGTVGVATHLVPFLPQPTAHWDEKTGKYAFEGGNKRSIGRVGSFHGVAANFVRAYAWVMAHGAEWLKRAAEISVLNNNYLLAQMLEINGVTAPFGDGSPRIDQVRYSWDELAKETGFTSEDLARRAVDFGMHFFLSHHPFVVPNPATVEPTESATMADLDNHAARWVQLAHEARHRSELIETAPRNTPIHAIDPSPLDDPGAWAITWRAYLRKHRS
jgi:glycine dehydrogenase subunit 2